MSNCEKNVFSRPCCTILVTVVAATLTCLSAGAAMGQQVIAHNTPSYVSTAKNLGAEILPRRSRSASG